MSSQVRRVPSARNARRAAVIGAVGALVVGVGVASAAPGDGGEVTACYHKTSGALRVIDPGAGQQCSKSEAELAWPSVAAALAAGSVTGGPGGVVTDDSLTKDDLGPNSVEASELADGSVDTGALGADAVTAAKVLNGEIGTDELAGDAVTSGKIDDGTIASGDLADGSVTTEKVTANLTTSVAPLTSPGGTDFTRTVTSFGHETTAGHKLLVMGQVQLTCTCGETDTITVRWQVFDDDVPVSQEYRSVLTRDSPTTPGTVSALIPSANAGLRTYQLKVTTASAGDPVTATNDQLAVIDLGR